MVCMITMQSQQLIQTFIVGICPRPVHVQCIFWTIMNYLNKGVNVFYHDPNKELTVTVTESKDKS